MHLCTICEIMFPVGGPWEANVTLGTPWKIVAIFMYEP